MIIKEIGELQDESKMEPERVEEPCKAGERSCSSNKLYEQEKGSSGSQVVEGVDTGRMQDGVQESKGLPSGESEHGAGTEAAADEGLQLGLSLSVLHRIEEAGPSVLDEKDGCRLGISYEEEQEHLLSAGKRGSKGGRGRGRVRGRKPVGGDTEETNDPLGNDIGKGRRGRGRGSKRGAVATEELYNSVENDGGGGRRGGSRGGSRGRGRDPVKAVCNVEPQSDGTDRVGGDVDISQQNNAMGDDEHHLSVNGIPRISGGRSNRGNSGLLRMRGQLVHGRGSGKSTGKRGRSKDGVFEAENIRAPGENASDISDNVFEASMISGRDSQVTFIVSPSAGATTAEMNNAGDTNFRKSQGAGERGFVTMKGHKQPKFTPDMEDMLRIWLSEIQILSDWPLHIQLDAVSPELRLKFSMGNSSTEEFQPIKVPLFKSVASSTSETTQEDRPRTCKDILMHVGGPVWALDWCPQRPGWVHTGGDKTEFLAVGAHPTSSPFNRLGACLKGKGLIQIWALDLKDYVSEEENQGADKSLNGRKSASVGLHTSGRGRVTSKMGVRGSGKGRGKGKGKGQEAACALGMDLNARAEDADIVEPCVLKWHESWHEEDLSARMVLGFTHEGLVTWDAKWQPVEESKNNLDDREILRLGFLAVVLGDGSLQVFDVPLPSIFSKSTMSSSEEPLIVNIQPVFRCSGLQRRGFKSIPVSLEWSTWEPYDRLLVGFHDASVGVWKFTPNLFATDTRPLMFFQADSLPLRSVAWAPDGSGPQGRHLIVTAGHSGWVKFWDLRYISTHLGPANFKMLHLEHGLVAISRSVLMSMDDGTLRLLGIQNASSTTPATGQPWRGTHAQGVQCYLCSSFAIWSVQVSRFTGLVAYAGASGSVLQFQLTEKAILKEGARAREPHYLCGAFEADSENGPLTLISPNSSEPVQMKKSSTEWGRTPTSKRNFLASYTLGPDSVIPNDSRQLAIISDDTAAPKPKRAKGIAVTGTICQVNRHRDAQKNSFRRSSESKELVLANTALSEKTGELQSTTKPDTPSTSSGPLVAEGFPCRNVAVHRVRWNCNHLKRQWLAYGGAAGLIRCQQVYSMKKKKK